MATATSFGNMVYDPISGQTKEKKAKDLPYLNPNETSQGYLPYTGNQQQQATPNKLEQGNANVMGAAQNAALNQQNPANNAIRNQAQQMTQNVMQNPSMGMDWAKYNAGQLSQYDLNAAKTAQKAKQELGGMGGAGQVQSNLINLMLQQNTGRSEFDNTLQKEAYQNQKADTYDATNLGLTTADSFDRAQSSAIENLLKVRSGFEGERSQDSANNQQMSVLDKTFGQDMAKLVASQDWTGVQNQLDREADVARQNKDIAATEATQQRQIAADMAQLKSTQDFTGIQADIDRKLKVAESTKDRDLQNSIVTRQIALDKWKQENGQQFTAGQNAINNALQLTLKDKDATLQTSLLTLKGQIDKGLLIDEQSFIAIQNELTRKAEAEANAGNWANAVEITKLKGEIDKEAQKAQQEFATKEREASQIWTTSERVDADKLSEASKVLDRLHEKSLQENDIEAQKDIEDKRGKLQLKLQTNDMDNDERRMFLQDYYDTARANGDVSRQKQILDFQHTQEIKKIGYEFGLKEQMAYIDKNIQIALQNNDAVNAEMLQFKRLEAEAYDNDKNRTLQKAELDLQKAGVDMAKLDAEYEKLQVLVDAGQLDPSVLTQFVQKTMSTAGVKLTAPDPNAAKKEAQAKMDELKNQFILTHPEYAIKGSVFDSSGKLLTGTLTPEGLKKFNEFYNSSVYGELTSEEKDAKKNAGKLGAEDLQYGDVGDVFKIDAATNFNGQTIPPGEYKVINADYSKGNKFFGTKDNFTKRVLVDSTGKWIATLKDVKSGAEGNIVSNLWAQ